MKSVGGWLWEMVLIWWQKVAFAISLLVWLSTGISLLSLVHESMSHLTPVLTTWTSSSFPVLGLCVLQRESDHLGNCTAWVDMLVGLTDIKTRYILLEINNFAPDVYYYLLHHHLCIMHNIILWWWCKHRIRAIGVVHALNWNCSRFLAICPMHSAHSPIVHPSPLHSSHALLAPWLMRTPPFWA